jgi:hypothetical protein
MSRSLQSIARAVLAAAGLAVLGFVGAGGCNIVGPAFLLVHGPEKTSKVHTLEKQRPTVVFIDDRSSAVPRRGLRVIMGQQAEQTLLSEGVLKDAISSESALAAASKDRYGQPLSITDIGKAVGAEVVVYITIDRFALSPDGSSFTPTVDARAKVVDVIKDARVWPDDERGFAFTVQMRQRQGFAPADASSIAKAQSELAADAGLGIAQLFFDHERQATAGREKESLKQ